MTTKNKLLTMLILSSSAIATTAMLNKWITLSATSKNSLKDTQASCFHWRFGSVYYTKAGSGKPLLLIHDLNAASSGYEWNKIISSLQEHHTVYTIDLLGCGRSEKPCLTYTNYLYVQLISDFIKSEIGHRTDVITTGKSAAIAVMTCHQNPDLFDHMMFVSPENLSSCSQIPGKYAKAYKTFLDFPVLGTLLYHIAFSKQAIQEMFTSCYFYNPYAVKDSYINAYREAAHLGTSPKSIYASVHCSYTNCNFINALKTIDNSICLVGGTGISDIHDIFHDYVELNPAIEYTYIANTKHLPQLEKPGEFLSAVQMFFG